MSIVHHVGHGILDSSCNLVSPEAEHIASEMNRLVEQERQIRNELGAQYHELSEAYIAECMAARPSFPTPEMIKGIEAAMKILDDGTPYGDHLGYSTKEDRDAGLPDLGPMKVRLETRTNYLGITVGGPHRPDTASRLWVMTDEEVARIVELITAHGWRVVDQWAGNDFVSMRLAPSVGQPKPSQNDDIALENSDEVISHAHNPIKCAGHACPIHNRSDHSMRSFPQHWRSDIGIMERICPHGVGHPDPDDPFADPVHGCDGCCASTNSEEKRHD